LFLNSHLVILLFWWLMRCHSLQVLCCRFCLRLSVLLLSFSSPSSWSLHYNSDTVNTPHTHAHNHRHRYSADRTGWHPIRWQRDK
jgi:hypothetical protein